MVSPPGSFRHRAAAVLLGTLAALAAGEIFLAWRLPPPARYLYPQPLHVRDQTLGWLPRPGQRAFTHDKPVATNSLGFRSGELAAEKPPGGLRILCLGDSQTFGNGVAQDLTYAARLQALLQAALPGRPVEVVNAGVQAYDTVQEVDLLERLAPSLRLDVVTIGFYLNDIGEVLRPDKAARVQEETGEFERRGPLSRFTPYRLIYFLKRSRWLTALNWQVHVLRTRSQATPIGAILEGKTPPELARGWEVIETALRRAHDLARSRDFRLIVFPVPTPQEFTGEYPHEQYRSRFVALAARIGLEHFDPTPAMLEEGGGHGAHFVHWDGHINSATHDRIARTICERIVAGAEMRGSERGARRSQAANSRLRPS